MNIRRKQSARETTESKCCCELLLMLQHSSVPIEGVNRDEKDDSVHNVFKRWLERRIVESYDKNVKNDTYKGHTQASGSSNPQIEIFYM